MKKLFSFTIVFVAALILASCSQPHYPDIKGYSYQKKSDIDLVGVSYIIVNDLENSLKAPISQDDTIIVASFVDVNNLQVSSSFGRIMAEQVGSRLAQKGYKVKELKLRQNSVFVEEGKGEFLLSREIKDLSLNHSASAVVVGTYARSRDKIYVSTRIVAPEDSVILASADYGIPADLMLQKSLLEN